MVLYVKINGEEIRPDTLSMVILSLGGNVHIQGEAINEQDRMDLAQVLAGFNEGDTVEFDVEDKEYHRLHGAGEVRALSTKESGVGTLMRIKYIIGIQYIK